MNNNLPPGVTINMIPGNRREDAVYEECLDRVMQLTVDEFHSRLMSDAARKAVMELVEAVADRDADDLMDYLSQRGPED